MRAFVELVLLLLAASALYLAGSAATPFYTKGEPREALVAREILRTGDWLVPRRPEGRLARKPPLYYWLAAGAMATVPGSPERAARLPSIAGGVVGVLATWAAARAAFGPAAGLPAGLVLATSLAWVQEATRARIDMTLAAPLAVLLLCWVRLAAAPSLGFGLLAVAAATAAVLAKGPVGVALPALAALLAWIPNVRRTGLLRFAAPLAVATALAGLWYGLAYLDQGRAFLDIVLAENVGRYLDTAAAHTGHRHGVAYLLGLGLVGLLPWTPLLGLAAGAARDLRRPPVAVLAAWAIVVPVFFSLSSGKRPEYLLPMYPAVAVVLGAGLTVAPGPGVRRLTRALARLYAPGLALLAGALLAYGAGIDPAAVAARWLTPRDAAITAALAAAGGRHAVIFVALAAASLALAVVAERYRRDERWLALGRGLGLFFLAGIGVFQLTLHPALAQSQSVAPFLHAIGPQLPPGEPLYAFEPINQEIRFYAPPALAGFPPGGLDRPGLLLAWEREVARRRARSGEPLTILARSAAAAGSRGPLCLVRVPAGPLERIRAPGHGGRRQKG